MSFVPDIIVEVHYDWDEPMATRVFTNAKMEAIGEIVDAWMQDQIFGRWKDPPEGPQSEPAFLDTYVISIGWRISDDASVYASTTRNRGLTLGIMADASRLLDRDSSRSSPCPSVRNSKRGD